MPLNTTHYLTKQGWKGHGTPLDGEKGRGLKKPLIIPQKRNLGGVGQNRDRAVEWWDDIFAVESDAPAGPRRALSTLAKQEHARRMLMSNFVRGEVVGQLSISTEETEVSVIQTQSPATDTSSQDTRDASSSIVAKEHVQSSRQDKKARKHVKAETSDHSNARKEKKRKREKSEECEKKEKRSKREKSEKRSKKEKREKREKRAKKEKREKSPKKKAKD
ncbi:hypothetical protein MEQU1_000494 [Malassezia equina]|uniref:G-patch domain-containing protein n=1 Tax=Malassezia equina TaxID=1381935 RepID=A0AAF0E9X5_9BASI|nr:hypothetical protein MEQU1_000494 [Malassezia equina]